MRVEATLISQADGRKTDTGELGVWGRLFTKKYRARTMIGVLIMVFQREFVQFFKSFPGEGGITHTDAYTEWSGINALLYYGPTLVRSIGLQGETSGLLVSGGIGVVQFLAVGPAVVYIDRLGKYHFPAISFVFSIQCAD
jgi:hypothetical protein